jgi:hypothetical protein
MADFTSWQHSNLVAFATDMQRQDEERLALIRELCGVIESLCSNDCKLPVRNEVYRRAMDAIK